MREPERAQRKKKAVTTFLGICKHPGCSPKSVIASFVLCHASYRQCFSFASILRTHCGVYIVGPDSFSGLFYIEAILCVDVCKCVDEPICRPDEHDRKERVFF